MKPGIFILTIIVGAIAGICKRKNLWQYIQIVDDWILFANGSVANLTAIKALFLIQDKFFLNAPLYVRMMNMQAVANCRALWNVVAPKKLKYFVLGLMKPALKIGRCGSKL